MGIFEKWQLVVFKLTDKHYFPVSKDWLKTTKTHMYSEPEFKMIIIYLPCTRFDGKIKDVLGKNMKTYCLHYISCKKKKIKKNQIRSRLNYECDFYLFFYIEMATLKRKLSWNDKKGSLLNFNSKSNAFLDVF